MNPDDRPTLLAIQHVPWEGPHRILDACGALHVHTAKPLAGQPLPGHDEVAGAVVMGGPMNVDEVERFPALAAEREWLAAAVERGMPVLGICLGAQLLARALGAEVRAGEGPEIGFALVEAWLAVPEMIGDARRALGDAGAHALPERASEAEPALVERTTPGFE